jgi:hyaluronan synthase
MMRASRSLLGTLETTSGALAMYRASILFKHKHRYVAAGTYGDDRCLAMYSALEGEVVGVNEAIVWSEMPLDIGDTYRQRLRWSKSWWCMIPFVLTNMRHFRQMFFPLFGMFKLAVAPVTVGYVAWAMSVNGYHGITRWDMLGLYLLLNLFIRYAETALYMVERPGMGVVAKIGSWLVLTPIEAIYNLGFLNPTKYIALAKLQDHGWGTRGNAHGERVPVQAARRSSETEQNPDGQHAGLQPQMT